VGTAGLELAGVATHEEAARIGYGVEESVRRLQRFHWVARRLGEIALAYIAPTPEWEVKGALSLHQWLDAEHAEALRVRIGELRHPAPRLDAAPDGPLEAFLREVERPRDTIELLAGLGRVARASLAADIADHLERSNPLVDHPTRRILRTILGEVLEMRDWLERALAAFSATTADGSARAAAWEAHLRAYLDIAGGIAGAPAAGPMARDALPPARAVDAFRPDTTPRRDARFRGTYDFDFPPHAVVTLPHVSAAERNLALLCKRLLEMDVPEMMASFLLEDRAMPWERHRAYRRQLWDEARHSMMGEAALAAAGIDWRDIPLNVGFSLRLNRHATPRERALVLYAIEQSLMPADTGKRHEYETARAAGDELSAHFHDYDWADEVLHAQIGRAWLREIGMLGPGTLERGRAVHERTWKELDRYRTGADRPLEWWHAFVRSVLGVDSAVTADDLQAADVIAE
jgi:hypothetical protein